MDLEGIGKRIRKQRELLGYTRESFAEQLDVTPKFCSDIELGLKGMSIATLCRVSSVLNLSTDYILFGRLEDTDSFVAHSLLQCCPIDKQSHLTEIIKAFLNAIKE